MNQQTYTTSQHFLTQDADFQKYWKINEKNEPTDQIINAYQAGKNKIDREIQRFEDFQKKEIESFVKSATDLMIVFFKSINSSKVFEIKLRILSPDEIEFLFIFEKEYFNVSYNELYNKANELEEKYSHKDKEISFRLLGTPSHSEINHGLLVNDGFTYSFIDLD